ncbi:hypothetical protein P6P90_04380 [Ectobacillus antri]|jgi:hypothetical protein|uniref:DUF3679 domain-containing protein n=1 Tax=Ectobacillus antri TaxID=2486280 RepID=A0ABT6H225_9BACI|nr:hypothetical protein [Ectobacillus antri]MDG4655476.1 hypothetical protein [Ectobacillus antri]MDG5753234.1 hypothetical protein [Ectobacillus antri]
MEEFLKKCGLLLVLLSVITATCIHLVGDGLKRMKGYSYSYDDIAHVAGKAEPFRIEEKERQLESIHTFNIWSGSAQLITSIVEELTYVVTDGMIQKIRDIFTTWVYK